MSQSTKIFAAILFAFIVYITMRGQLPAYLNLFKPQAKADKTTFSFKDKSSGGGGFPMGLLQMFGIGGGSSSGSSDSTASDAQTAMQAAQYAAQFLA